MCICNGEGRREGGGENHFLFDAAVPDCDGGRGNGGGVGIDLFDSTTGVAADDADTVGEVVAEGG